MFVIGGETQMIDPVLMLLICPQCVLVLSLKQLNAAIIFTDKQQVTILSELNSGCHILELKQLALRLDLLNFICGFRLN